MDERKLLLLIKNYPEVYNPNHKSYRKLEARSAAWAKIAQEMNEDENYCKKRWKNIRAVVIRDFIDPKKQSDYYLREYLDFYLPFMRSAKLQEIPTLPENVKTDPDADTETQDNTDTSEPKEKLKKSFRGTKRKPIKFETNQDTTQSVEEKYPDNTSNTSVVKDVQEQKINCDKAFLISIYDDFKCLDPRRKRLFKGRIMNLLNELHDGMINEESIKSEQARNIGFTIECGDMKWSTGNNTDNS